MLSPRLLAALAAALLTHHALALEPAKTIPLWPDGVQGPVYDKPPEVELPQTPKARQVQRVAGVTEATLLYFPAPAAKSVQTAVIVSPGGGFSKLALDLEGTEIASYLNEWGVSVFVLKYRTSPGGSAEPQLGPAMEAQRAISLVRSRAAEFGVKPERVGLLGVSAGGQVALIAATNHARRLYEAKLPLDQTPCRPDFLALVYPYKILDAKDATKLRSDILPDATMPPVFIAHAVDDPGAKIEGSILLFQQLHAAKVPVEFHAYVKGGHGFGLRPAPVPCPTDWPVRFGEWLGVTGFLQK